MVLLAHDTQHTLDVIHSSVSLLLFRFDQLIPQASARIVNVGRTIAEFVKAYNILLLDPARKYYSQLYICL